MKTAASGDDYTPLGFWFDSLPEPVRPLEPQDFADDIDVAIVGAGFTGLWTAYYLKQAQPELRRSEERRVGKECRSRWSPYH